MTSTLSAKVARKSANASVRRRTDLRSTSDTSNPLADEAVAIVDAVVAVASLVAEIEAEAGGDAVMAIVAVATAIPVEVVAAVAAVAVTVAGADHVMAVLSTWPMKMPSRA